MHSITPFSEMVIGICCVHRSTGRSYELWLELIDNTVQPNPTNFPWDANEVVGEAFVNGLQRHHKKYEIAYRKRSRSICPRNEDKNNASIIKLLLE